MIFIKKIRSEKDEKEYFLVSNCEDGGAAVEIALVSVEDFKCYRGLLDDDYVQARSIKMRIPYKTYLTETHSALTQMSPDGLRFVYNVAKLDNDDVVFEWKKHVKEEEVRIVLGSLNLASFVSADFVMLLLSKLSIELQHLYRKTEEMNRLETERQDLLNMVKETNEWKNKLEAEMYAKFVLVLNSKKKKIKELQDQLEHSTGSNEKKLAANTTKRSNINSKNKEERNSNNSLDIFSSDEELSIASCSRVGRYISSSRQSTKKMKLEGTKSREELSKSGEIKASTDDHSVPITDPSSDDLFDEL